MRKIKFSLRTRILFFILSASLAIILIATLLLFNLQRNQLIDLTQTSVIALSNLVEANLRHAMRSGDRELVNQSVLSIMAGREFEALKILDNQGVVRASSVASDIGNRFDRTDSICQTCHAGGEHPGKSSVLFTEPGGRQVMLTVNLIQNQEECHTCHSPEVTTLGLLLVETSLTELNKEMVANVWQITLVILTVFTFFMLLIFPIINRRMIRPLEQLSKGVVEISQGNYDSPVELETRGDLDELAGSFESMRQQLLLNRLEMERKEQELAIMNDVGLAATQLLELPKILEFALDTMTNRLGMADARIFLWDEDAERYVMRAARGVSQEQKDEIERRRQSGWDITQQVIETGKAVFVPNMAADARFQGVWENLEDRSYVNMPLLSRGSVIGSLSLVTPAGKTLTEREVDFLVAVGRDIGVAIDNALLFAVTQQSEQQALALYESGAKISATLMLDNTLDAVAQAAQQLVEADISMVGLVDENCERVMILSASGYEADKLVGLIMAARGQAHWTALLEGQSTIQDANQADHPSPFIPDLIERGRIASILWVPLLRGDRFLGLIEVMARHPRRFGPRHAQLLKRLAQKVSMSIENALLYRQLHYIAILEERDRLAREMHDHLSQGLGYLKVRATMADELLSEGKIAQAHENILEIKRASQALYTDVREDIFNLRTAVTEQLGFFAVLQEYLINYKTHYGLEIELEIEDGNLPVISPEVASQLLRIIQEALANVRRHSGASSASIHFMSKDQQFIIVIEDKGQGFLVERVKSYGGQHIGLQIMRERAESIGGNLTVDSTPGQGTRVLVQLSMERSE